MSEDLRQRFIFPGSDCRGHIVKLEKAWQAMHAQRAYPPAIQDLLGEAVAATALMMGSVKIQGSLTLQARGEGPVDMLVVQAKPNGGLRALAKWKSAAIGSDLQSAFGAKAQLSIIMDPGPGHERYQGIVAMQGDNLQQALSNYFVQSEQLNTRFWLSADAQHAAGMFLQQLPGVQTEDSDAWGRIGHLAATLTHAELLSLPAATLLRRLFHQEDLQIFAAEALHFQCDCSRAVIADVLRSIGYAEAQSILLEQGEINVDCEFCGANHRFDKVDIEQLFAATTLVSPPKRHH